jgi:hypothetical protein
MSEQDEIAQHLRENILNEIGWDEYLERTWVHEGCGGSISGQDYDDGYYATCDRCDQIETEEDRFSQVRLRDFRLWKLEQERQEAEERERADLEDHERDMAERGYGRTPPDTTGGGLG